MDVGCDRRPLSLEKVRRQVSVLPFRVAVKTPAPRAAASGAGVSWVAFRRAVSLTLELRPARP